MQGQKIRPTRTENKTISTVFMMIVMLALKEFYSFIGYNLRYTGRFNADL